MSSEWHPWGCMKRSLRLPGRFVLNSSSCGISEKLINRGPCPAAAVHIVDRHATRTTLTAAASAARTGTQRAHAAMSVSALTLSRFSVERGTGNDWHRPVFFSETTSYLPSILSRPWRAFRGRDVQAGWSPGARGCWEASSGPLGLHVVHFRSNRADRPTSRPPPRECSLGRSAPTR